MSPRSDKRKTGTSAKAKRRLNARPVKLVKGNTAQISKRKIADLRQNADFSAAIKTGRALNALAFAGELLGIWSGKKKPHERRNANRSVLIMASYVYESLLLVKKLDKDYGQDAAFQDAALLLVDETRWEVSKIIRNRAGFHLDHRDEVTTTTLKQMPDKNFDLFSSVDIGPFMTTGNYYFNFADEIDWTYFLDKFGVAGFTTEKQVSTFIEKNLSGLMVDVTRALRKFHSSLLRRLGL